MKKCTIFLVLIFLHNCFLYGVPDDGSQHCQAGLELLAGNFGRSICYLKSELVLLDNDYKMAIDNPLHPGSIHSAKSQQQLIEITQRLKEATEQLYPLESVKSMGDIEDRIDLLPLTEGFFNTVQRDLTSIHTKVNDARKYASKDRLYALRARTELATAWQQLGDVKNDLRQFLAMIDRQDYQIGQPKTFDERKIAHHLYNKRVCHNNTVPIQYLNLITKWVPKLLSETGQVVPIDQSAVNEFMQEYNGESNGQTVASQLNGKVLSNMASVDEFVTDVIVGSGDRKRMLRGIADIIEGCGGFLTKQWKDKTEKLKQSVAPSPRSNIVKRVCKRMFNSMLFRSARIARWCIVKVGFSQNPFERKEFQKRFAGKFLSYIGNALSDHPQHAQIRTWQTWLRNWFTINGWRSNS